MRVGGKRTGCGHRVYEKSPLAPGRVIEGKALIVMPGSGETYTLNGTAARIWELANGRRAVKEIAAELCNEFDVAEPEAGRDALELLEKLEKEGIVIRKG